MKKYIFYLPLILLLLIMSGCGMDKDSLNSQIYEYFPFKENVSFEYEGEGHQLASYQIYNAFINANRLQRRLAPVNYNKETEIFEVKNGELRLINGDTFHYHFENQTENPPQMDMLILKAPLKLGAKWTISGNDTAQVTGVDVDITVPAGSFKALEITSAFETGYTQKDYYVKGIGLVQTTFSSQSSAPITSALAKYTENTGVSCEYECFYPIPDTDEVSIQTGELELWTNYDFNELVNSLLYKGSPDGLYGPLLSAGRIIDITFAANTSAVLVNFDKDIYEQGYISELEESATLYSAANTIGRLLGVDQVFIHVEGKPYSGIYVKLTEDSAFITKDTTIGY